MFRKTVPDDRSSNEKTSLAAFRRCSRHSQISTFRRTETGSATESRRRYTDVLDVCRTSSSDIRYDTIQQINVRSNVEMSSLIQLIQLNAKNEIIMYCIVTDCVSREGKAIGSARPSISLFPLYLLNRLTFELDFVCVWGGGHDHSSPEIKGQGHRSWVNVQRLRTW